MTKVSISCFTTNYVECVTIDYREKIDSLLIICIAQTAIFVQDIAKYVTMSYIYFNKVFQSLEM